MRTPTHAQEVFAKIEHIRDVTVADDTIKVGDARWRKAMHMCQLLYNTLGYVHPDYYDDPYPRIVDVNPKS